MPNQVGIPSNQAAMEVNSLRTSVQEFANQANKQTYQMIKLSRVIALLTVIMTVAVVVQVIIAILK